MYREPFRFLKPFLIIIQSLYFVKIFQFLQTPFLNSKATSKLLSHNSSNMAEIFPTLEQFRMLQTCTMLFRYGDYLTCHSPFLKNMHEKVLKEAGETWLESQGLLNNNWKNVAETVEQEQQACKKWKQSWLSKFSRHIDTPMTNIIKSLAASYHIPVEDAVCSIKFYAKQCMDLQNGIDVEDDLYEEDLYETACFLFRDEEAIQNGVLIEEVANEATQLLNALYLYKMRHFDYIRTRKDDRKVEVVDLYIVSDEFVTRGKPDEIPEPPNICAAGEPLIWSAGV